LFIFPSFELMMWSGHAHIRAIGPFLINEGKRKRLHKKILLPITGSSMISIVNGKTEVSPLAQE
jgi:hypothetical protein